MNYLDRIRSNEWQIGDLVEYVDRSYLVLRVTEVIVDTCYVRVVFCGSDALETGPHDALIPAECLELANPLVVLALAAA